MGGVGREGGKMNVPAAPGRIESLTGRLALRYRLISPEDLDRALSAWKERPSAAFEDVLLDGKFLSPADLGMLREMVGAVLASEPASRDRDGAAAPGGRLGEYELIREIGRGAMGVVYEAKQEGLNRRVALKVLPFDLTVDAKAIERFRREAEAAAKLNHQGIIKVLTIGVDKGLHYYAMDLVEGRSLDAVIDTERLPFGRAAEVIRDAALALDYAHSCGVVHRDMKPANVMIRKDGTVLIGDFGLARVETTATLSRLGEIMGTPMYMSPEQARGDGLSVDHRTDIYSLGATMYEALTLFPPFSGEDVHAVLSQVINTDPRQPRSLNALIPRDLETICLKAMDKDAARRYGSAGEMADDIKRFLEGKPITAKPVSRTVRMVKLAKRNRPAAALMLVIAVALACLAAYLAADFMTNRMEIARLLDSASADRKLGDESFARLFSSTLELYSMEDRLGEVQESRGKAELLESVSLLHDEQNRFYGRALEKFGEVLKTAPGNAEASQGIAAIMFNRCALEFEQAKRTGNFADLKERFFVVRTHDVAGAFSDKIDAMIAYVDAGGSLEILSDPPGAAVSLSRISSGGETPGPPPASGPAPFRAARLAPGSYRVSLAKEGFTTVEFPVNVRRLSETRVDPVRLFRPGEVPADLAFVPGGEFVFGGLVPGANRKEIRRIPGFLIGRCEVTFAEYLEFLNGRASQGEYAHLIWERFVPRVPGTSFGFEPASRKFETSEDWWSRYGRWPVWGIPWEGAVEYCKWKTEASKDAAAAAGIRRYLSYSLPTEEQWEKAARGTDGRRYPWGDAFDERRCNNEYGKMSQGRPVTIDSVGFYPDGVSPYGCHDMAGNVEEWTATAHKTEGDVIVKGGDLFKDWLYLSSPARRPESKQTFFRAIGFRVAAEWKNLGE